MVAPLVPDVEFIVTLPPSVSVPDPVIAAPGVPVSIVTLVGLPRVYVDRASVVPALTVNAPLTVVLPPSVLVLLPEIVRLV
jgi:hypothetical protein